MSLSIVSTEKDVNDLTLTQLPPDNTFLQLADFVTTDIWATSALCTAISAAMFHLGDTGFNSLKMLAATNIGALLIRMDKEGFSTDTIMANKVQAVITVALTVLAFA